MTTAARPTLAISQLELFTAVESVKGRMGSNFFATQFQSHASKNQLREKEHNDTGSEELHFSILVFLTFWGRDLNIIGVTCHHLCLHPPMTF